MSKIKRISIIAILITTMLLSITTTIYAEDDITSGFTEKFAPGDITGVTEAMNKGKVIVSTLQTIGGIVAVVGLMVLGIKYMAGSVEQRAEYKKTMIPYLIGIILIALTVTIVSLLYQITNQIGSEKVVVKPGLSGTTEKGPNRRVEQ